MHTIDSNSHNHTASFDSAVNNHNITTNKHVHAIDTIMMFISTMLPQAILSQRHL
jgi:hypothetical protein